MADDAWFEDEEYYRPLSPSMTRTRPAGKSRYGYKAKSAKTMARGVQKFVYSDGECLQMHKPPTPSHTAMHKEQRSASRVDHEGDVYEETHRMSRTSSPDRDYGGWSGSGNYEPTAREYGGVDIPGEGVERISSTACTPAPPRYTGWTGEVENVDDTGTPPTREYGLQVSGEFDAMSEGEITDGDNDMQSRAGRKCNQPSKTVEQNRSKAARTREALHAAVRHVCSASNDRAGKADRAPIFGELFDFSGQHKCTVGLFEPFLRVFTDSMTNPVFYSKSAAMNVLTDVQDAALWGMDQMPDMDPDVATMFLPADEAYHAPLKCPDKAWRAVDEGVKAAYRINSATARLMNTHTILAYSMRTHVNELQRKGVELPAEMLSCALALTGSCAFLAATMGREAHRLIMTRRRIWLAQGKLPEHLQKALFDLPVRSQDDTLFGPEAGSTLEAIQTGMEAQRTRRRLGMMPATTARSTYRMHPYRMHPNKRVGNSHTMANIPWSRGRSFQQPGPSQDQQRLRNAAADKDRRFRKPGGKRPPPMPAPSKAAGTGGGRD